MRRITCTAQAGYALILMVLLLMGVGGVVIAGFTQGAKQEVEQERYLHNQRVLREAKQALLQYAYNYPQMGNGAVAQGPGRLPCPDTDNNGIGEGTAYCGSPNGLVGRFPWNDSDMQFYDARDASGERLWYAVSRNFANNPALVINSDTLGTITVQDRSGAPVHDATAGSGVVAVIIAPGPAIDRNGVMQDRAADPNAPANYLDLFGAIDNADFVNGTTNGFVTGPIFNRVDGTLPVNDQMIVITAAEVIAMAEKATLQAYRTVIDEYHGQTGNIYPWLYNYDDSDASGLDEAELRIKYPADNLFATEEADYLSNYGRIPSIFGDYFSDQQSEKIDSKISFQFDFDFSTLSGVLSSANGTLDFNSDVITLSFPATTLASNVGFDDLDGSGGQQASLTATLAAPLVSPVMELFFWDDDDLPTNSWSLCPNGGDDITDCHRDFAGNPQPGGANSNKERILRVLLQFTLDGTGGLNIDTDYATNPATNITVTSPPSGASHAWVEAQLDVANLLPSSNLQGALTITATYEFDEHYHQAPDTFGPDPVSNVGSLTVDDLLVDSTLTVGMRYFPEVPRWALTNEWHDSIRMAYADDYRPDTLPAPIACTPGVNCLQIGDAPGAPNDKASLLVLAGSHVWSDDNDPGLHDDLADVFDAGNVGDDPLFLMHEGNDKILVIEEL